MYFPPCFSVCLSVHVKSCLLGNFNICGWILVKLVINVYQHAMMHYIPHTTVSYVHQRSQGQMEMLVARDIWPFRGSSSLNIGKVSEVNSVEY